MATPAERSIGVAVLGDTDKAAFLAGSTARRLSGGYGGADELLNQISGTTTPTPGDYGDERDYTSADLPAPQGGGDGAFPNGGGGYGHGKPGGFGDTTGPDGDGFGHTPTNGHDLFTLGILFRPEVLTTLVEPVLRTTRSALTTEQGTHLGTGPHHVTPGPYGHGGDDDTTGTTAYPGSGHTGHVPTTVGGDQTGDRFEPFKVTGTPSAHGHHAGHGVHPGHRPAPAYTPSVPNGHTGPTVGGGAGPDTTFEPFKTTGPGSEDYPGGPTGPAGPGFGGDGVTSGPTDTPTHGGPGVTPSHGFTGQPHAGHAGGPGGVTGSPFAPTDAPDYGLPKISTLPPAGPNGLPNGFPNGGPHAGQQHVGGAPHDDGQYHGDDGHDGHDGQPWPAIRGTPGQDYPVYSSIPRTGFSCREQQYAGYYGDMDAQCQVFHICQEDGRHDAFLCPNGTVFNQRFFVCDWWYNFECDETPSLYHLNSQLYVGARLAPALREVLREASMALRNHNSKVHTQLTDFPRPPLPARLQELPVAPTPEWFLTGTSRTVASAITQDLLTVASPMKLPDTAPLVTLAVPHTEDQITLVPRTTVVLGSTDQRHTLVPRTRRTAFPDSVNPEPTTLVQRTRPSEVWLVMTVRITAVPRTATSDTADHTTEAPQVQTSRAPQLTEGRSTMEEPRDQRLTAGRITVAPPVPLTTEDQLMPVPALLTSLTLTKTTTAMPAGPDTVAAEEATEEASSARASARRRPITRRAETTLSPEAAGRLPAARPTTAVTQPPQSSPLHSADSASFRHKKTALPGVPSHFRTAAAVDAMQRQH
ncbi:hypothetical protein HPB52_015159 [Rhipicephalus sanguineus]|uniref:Chitin-binding type-2 domain-containing protein n=1 Tax=Rhipicephalus sanguineus TaxID=34632 RepID=A0A9D4PMM3_RHISA|nr:hypothetical protein HPB52_015159 [Rhipicephalus sanguineus]